MIPLIEVRRGSLLDLCQRYRVRRLEVFGSAASEDAFDAQVTASTNFGDDDVRPRMD